MESVAKVVLIGRVSDHLETNEWQQCQACQSCDDRQAQESL